MMVYTKRRFAAELLVELERSLAEAEPPFDAARLGRWASKVHFKYEGSLDEGLYDPLMTVAMMEDGPDFELGIEAIRTLAKEML